MANGKTASATVLPALSTPMAHLGLNTLIETELKLGHIKHGIPMEILSSLVITTKVETQAELGSFLIRQVH